MWEEADVVKVLPQHSHEGAEKNHKNHQLQYMIFLLRFESSTFQLKIKHVTNELTCFACYKSRVWQLKGISPTGKRKIRNAVHGRYINPINII
jgi:hypothetical protein